MAFRFRASFQGRSCTLSIATIQGLFAHFCSRSNGDRCFDAPCSPVHCGHSPSGTATLFPCKWSRRPAGRVLGLKGSPVGEFMAFAHDFAGGVFVAAGKFDDDAADEVVVGADQVRTCAGART